MVTATCTCTVSANMKNLELSILIKFSYVKFLCEIIIQLVKMIMMECRQASVNKHDFFPLATLASPY